MESFIFDSYSIDATKTVLSFVYCVGGQRYEEKLYLPKPIPDSADSDVLKSLLFNLHLAMGISYWKMRCVPQMEIKSGSLTREQADFWNVIYTKGLGEFYYRNKIDFREIVAFPYSNTATATSKAIRSSKKELVGIGGGKDSVVTWELLKKKNIIAIGLVIETQKKYEAIDALLTVGDIPALKIRREMDNQLIEQKNNSLYHNGHVPISMIYAWIGVFASFLYDYCAFVVSNEKSADEGNTEIYGMTINHQWSKSKEFEDAFGRYLDMFVTPSILYYSPLRHMSELEIVKEFITYPHYLPVVTSCNRNFSVTRDMKGKLWCGECPKCVFAFLLFAAHLSKKDVLKLFGKNLFDDQTLESTFRDLTGKGTLKPFECVGTFDESREAVRMILAKGEFKENKINLASLI